MTTSPSPWQQTPSSSAPWHPPHATPPTLRPSHRLKSAPRRWDTFATAAHLLLPFAMRPLAGIRHYRRKLRAFRRKCRQPGSDFKIGAFVLRMECQAAQTSGLSRTGRKRVIKRSQDHGVPSSVRLEKVVARLMARQSTIHVPITAWRPGRTDLAALVKGGPPSCPSSPQQQQHSTATGVPVRIKSELKMVTETCTLPITSVVATSPRFSQKVGMIQYRGLGTILLDPDSDPGTLFRKKEPTFEKHV